jgi:hypothetical protein
MNKSEISRIQGELINATQNGGEGVLWNIARGPGMKGAAARAAIELVTSPQHDLDLTEAIIIATNEIQEIKK